MGLSKLSDEKINLCREMRLNNVSIKKIAKELQISPATVLRYVNDIKLDDIVLAKLRSEGAKEGNLNKIRSNLPSDIKLKADDLWNSKQTLNVYDENYDSKKVGDITEYQIIAKFILYDYLIYKPIGDRNKEDLLVVDKNNNQYKIQCKTARLINNGRNFIFQSYSINYHSKKKIKNNYIGYCDLFATYLRELDKIYLINVDKCPVTTVNFSLFKELCLSNSRFADDYLFDGSRDISEYM